MVEKAKIFYFTVFILVVFAFIFHITAMGHNHWKKAQANNSTAPAALSQPTYTTIGLFKRCTVTDDGIAETCFLNKFPGNDSCILAGSCQNGTYTDACQCDYLPSTKGIAACTIIAAVGLGLAIIVLFIHSINTSENDKIGLVLALFPLLQLLMAFVFILIALILVGSYLSRDVMHIVRNTQVIDWGALRQSASDQYQIRIDWSTGLEIIALVFTFFSLILYSVFVFKLGRRS